MPTPASAPNRIPKRRGILFIQKDRLYYYDEASSRILQFIFPPNTIRDLEVFDYDTINAQIKAFVVNNRLAAANILFIFAEHTIFEKIFLKSQTIDKDIVVQTFLENIPFENLSHKIYENPREFKVIAINKEIFTALKSAFEKLGFTVLGAIPQFVIGENFRTRTALDAQMVGVVLSRFELLQKQNIVEEEVIKSEPEGFDAFAQSSPEHVKQRQKYSIFALFAIVPIILILFIVLFLQQGQKAPAKSPVPKNVIVPTITSIPPTITESPTNVPSASPTTASPTAILKQIIR